MEAGLSARRIDQPRPGFFAIRLVKGGPEVSARLYLPCPLDPEFCGPLDRSRHLLAEVDGADAPDRWIARIWTSGREIGAAEFHFLRDDAAWCRWHAPHEPRANPRQAIDSRRVAPVMP